MPIAPTKVYPNSIKKSACNKQSDKHKANSRYDDIVRSCVTSSSKLSGATLLAYTLVVAEDKYVVATNIVANTLDGVGHA